MPKSYKITQVNTLTDKILQVFAKPHGREDWIDYRAGQYMMMFLENGDSRPFSVANAPLGAKQLEFHIQHTPDNVFSQALVQDIQQHGLLRLSGPIGHCTLHATPNWPTLFLAGGTGFAPMKALIETHLAKELTRPLHLLWGVQSEHDLYLEPQLNDWVTHIPHFDYAPICVEPSQDWHGERGNLSDLVQKHYPTCVDTHVYAAGPPEMITTVKTVLSSNGLNLKYFYSDQ